MAVKPFVVPDLRRSIEADNCIIFGCERPNILQELASVSTVVILLGVITEFQDTKIDLVFGGQ